jgi:hypothetical protein
MEYAQLLGKRHTLSLHIGNIIKNVRKSTWGLCEYSTGHLTAQLHPALYRGWVRDIQSILHIICILISATTILLHYDAVQRNSIAVYAAPFALYPPVIATIL